MKYLTLFILSTLLLACAPETVFNGNQVDKAPIFKFSKHIEKVISLGKADHFLIHIDTNYLHEQLTQNLNGDTTQFLNEFFCGQSDDGFKCVDFQSILDIHLLEATDAKDNVFNLKYQIKNKQTTIISDVSLIKKGTAYYLFSAVG